MRAFGVRLILVAKVNIIGTSDSSEIMPSRLVCSSVWLLSRVLFYQHVRRMPTFEKGSYIFSRMSQRVKRGPRGWSDLKIDKIRFQTGVYIFYSSEISAATGL